MQLVRSSVAAAVGMALAATPAAADVFKLFADIEGGVTFGKGLSGDRKDDAFFGQAEPGTYGLVVGMRALIVGATIQHQQFTDGKNLSTWTQFDAGLDLEVGLSALPKGAKKGSTGSFVELTGHVGFGVGTGQQVDPPLSNDEVTDKAFLVQGKLGIGKHINKVFDVGVSVPVTWGYFFKSGMGAVANDLSTHYIALHGSALLYLRTNIKVF